jgi:hypothetical protein
VELAGLKPATKRLSGGTLNHEPFEAGVSVREPQHLKLARPRDRRVEQARDAGPVWQSPFDGGFG